MDIISSCGGMKCDIAKHLSDVFFKENVQLHWADLICRLHAIIEENVTN